MAFFVLGCALIFSSGYGITGQVVGNDNFTREITPVFGLVFIIGGLVLFVEASDKDKDKEGGLEKNLALEMLESRRVITNTNELKRIAVKCGYDFKEVKEGYLVLNYDGSRLTTIPKHRDINSNTAKGILKSMAYGEPSFRPYQRS